MTEQFHELYGPWAMVAGGSEGLGGAWSEALAKRGLNVVMVARRAEGLEAHAQTLRQRYGVQIRTQVLDLSDGEAHSKLSSMAAEVDAGLVIYNAALSPSGSFAEMDPSLIAMALATNVVTPTLTLRAVLPLLALCERSGVVIVSPLAGFAGSAGLATYGATKAYLRVLAEALWEECRGSGTDVLATAPGAVSTPGLLDRPARRIPGQLTPGQIVESSLACLGKTPLHVPGRTNLVAATLLSRLLPRPAAAALMRRSSSGIASAPGSGRGDEQSRPTWSDLHSSLR
jgi:short-subunit dehydrogenase